MCLLIDRWGNHCLVVPIFNGATLANSFRRAYSALKSLKEESLRSIFLKSKLNGFKKSWINFGRGKLTAGRDMAEDRAAFAKCLNQLLAQL